MVKRGRGQPGIAPRHATKLACMVIGEGGDDGDDGDDCDGGDGDDCDDYYGGPPADKK